MIAKIQSLGLALILTTGALLSAIICFIDFVVDSRYTAVGFILGSLSMLANPALLLYLSFLFLRNRKERFLLLNITMAFLGTCLWLAFIIGRVHAKW